MRTLTKLRRFFSHSSGSTSGARTSQGEKVQISADGSTWAWLSDSTTSGWSSAYVNYGGGDAWHTVTYGWSAWLVLNDPTDVRYVRFHWDDNYGVSVAGSELVAEVDLDFDDIQHIVARAQFEVDLESSRGSDSVTGRFELQASAKESELASGDVKVQRLNMVFYDVDQALLVDLLGWQVEEEDNVQAYLHLGSLEFTINLDEALYATPDPDEIDYTAESMECTVLPSKGVAPDSPRVSREQDRPQRRHLAGPARRRRSGLGEGGHRDHGPVGHDSERARRRVHLRLLESAEGCADILERCRRPGRRRGLHL